MSQNFKFETIKLSYYKYLRMTLRDVRAQSFRLYLHKQAANLTDLQWA